MSDCIIFAGHIGERGYGLARDPMTRKTRLAHRLAYEQQVGPIPDGLVLHHTCGVTACVNPQHLEPMTYKAHRATMVSGVDRRRRSDARLTDEQAQYVRERYAAGETTYARLANEFGVHANTIVQIVRRRTYITKDGAS